jgi:hypothetical protein
MFQDVASTRKSLIEKLTFCNHCTKGLRLSLILAGFDYKKRDPMRFNIPIQIVGLLIFAGVAFCEVFPAGQVFWKSAEYAKSTLEKCWPVVVWYIGCI